MKVNGILHAESRLDSLGAFLSTLCIIHCTLLPGLVAAVPILAIDSLLSEEFHSGILFGSIALAIGGCLWGYRRHQKTSLIIFFTTGIIIVGISFFVQEEIHTAVAATGSLFLATAHIVNRFLCQSCVKCQKNS